METDLRKSLKHSMCHCRLPFKSPRRILCIIRCSSVFSPACVTYVRSYVNQTLRAWYFNLYLNGKNNWATKTFFCSLHHKVEQQWATMRTRSNLKGKQCLTGKLSAGVWRGLKLLGRLFGAWRRKAPKEQSIEYRVNPKPLHILIGALLKSKVLCKFVSKLTRLYSIFKPLNNM